MAVDHIDPVVSVNDGFQDWNEFIARLWCDKSNLQRVCDTCHDKKTAEERIARLTKQYAEELDTLEDIAKSDWTAYQIDVKLLNKTLSKYTAKKKTKGLESVVQRAQAIKDFIKIKARR
jgi:hypothetical protein